MEERKKCGLLDGHVCAQVIQNYSQDSACDGCHLFETYLSFKAISLEIERKQSEEIAEK